MDPTHSGPDLSPHACVQVRFADDEQTLMVIEWGDGHASTYPVEYLRGWCPCATCQGHSSRLRFIAVDGPRLAGLERVGSYALGMKWKDGHSTGIYPWRRLRELCPCAACGGPIEGTPPEAVARVS